MKIWNPLIILIMLLSAVSISQAAALNVSEPMIDYGTIKEGPPVVKKEILTNTGSQTLIITNLTTS